MLEMTEAGLDVIQRTGEAGPAHHQAKRNTQRWTFHESRNYGRSLEALSGKDA
jgi:hypothetical protein